MIVDVVVPTIGRPSLGVLLVALGNRGTGAPLGRVIVVDDRPRRAGSLPVPPGVLLLETSGGRGPAVARNAGWRRSEADWVAFLDDDVVPYDGWWDDLRRDLTAVSRDPKVGAVQGNVVVPMPRDRRPTDWERDVGSLTTARYVTADLAYRRSVLSHVGGFDEHFDRAYREDADLALRVRELGYGITTGGRRVRHPIGPPVRNISITRQRGNAADARMRAKHGRDWRRRAGAPRGRLALHAITSACALAALVGVALRRPRLALAGTAAWALATGQFAAVRLRPGPFTRAEIGEVLRTSVVIPPVAAFHRLRGAWIERRRAAAVLFDRDGTLVHDVPYNGDPARVDPVDGAGAAVARLRAHGVRIGVVSNQSGIARGLLTSDDARAVNARVDQIVGPFDGWWFCPHDDTAACTCRKPSAGMVHAAARALRVPVRRCVVIGDTVADTEAARRAGCRGILVPNAATRPEEVRDAAELAPDLDAAVDLVLGVGR